jgi:hypothetical protein
MMKKIDGRWIRCVLGVAMLVTARPPVRLSAQIGYDPGHSPFHDIGGGSGPRLSFGYLMGGRGRIPVGISDGSTIGVNYDVSVGGPFTFTFGGAYGLTTARIVNPFVGRDSATSGPVASRVVLLDAGILLGLTGHKTWHGLAPYFGASMGLAFGDSLKADSSGYTFGTKFTLMPAMGVRWYPSSRFVVQADARLVMWKLNYPSSFKEPNAVDSTRVQGVLASDNQWTFHPWFVFGVGWTF